MTIIWWVVATMTIAALVGWIFLLIWSDGQGWRRPTSRPRNGWSANGLPSTPYANADTTWDGLRSLPGGPVL